MYDWLKALHIIAMVAWMAGLFYLPRLFVYHADATPGSEFSETLKIMERRLLRAIMEPAMGATWLFGLWLAFYAGWFTSGAWWIWIKLGFVVAMSGFHSALKVWQRDFAADRNTRPGRFYRIANEVPTLLLIAIVLLVVLKPF
ncbi:protoporphyrinogen oxidase HemJ [Methylobrevis albus]|uniref:Protoporphyrinogen IX oxidase n=1 Tax=Methylobrevis albus TaxID=2793297 RepID=A0A931I1X5_9HYPH|nr:protoporphyrinogen oxidase HemJ [Methylobrevis albus]MBH0237785.1 protoporphyrinogen oxidase HemJ [Methylobrevis albus]